MSLRENQPLYFYELHEGDEDVFSDVLLAHDTEYDDREFLELVLESRGRLIERFEEDSLSEAIANDLEARHGFMVVDDRVLRVTVSVSSEEGETRVVAMDQRAVAREEDPEERYRTLVLDVEPEDAVWGDR